jgi:putative transposase
MRYPAPEKLEIIRLVEQSHLSVRRTLRHLGVPLATFYRWYEGYRAGGPQALPDKPSRPGRVWNRIPDTQRARIIDLALAEPDLSPRELAVRFIQQERYFVSEASIYRLVKAHDLITSPAFIVVKAADAFHTKTTTPNQLWQTDLPYLKVKLAWACSIFQPCSTISRATSSPGSFATWRPATSPTRWNWRSPSRAATSGPRH